MRKGLQIFQLTRNVSALPCKAVTTHRGPTQQFWRPITLGYCH